MSKIQLVPLLFFLYVNTLPFYIHKHAELVLPGDDTSIVITHDKKELTDECLSENH